MNYIYRNNSNNTVIYNNFIWLPGETLSVPCPVPDSLGLECLQEGQPPDPVLLHEDIVILPHDSISVSLPEPFASHNVALRILDMSFDSGVECRFNSSENNPVPIDTRGFEHVLPYELCSKIFFSNNLDITAAISITAIEVVS